MKALCEWCSDKEYTIAVKNSFETEELLCDDCYEEFKKLKTERSP